MLNTQCDRRYIYCRPGGETYAPVQNTLSIDDVIVVSAAYFACIAICQVRGDALPSVKLTGGDPALLERQKLLEIVCRLKQETGVASIEILSRSPNFGNLAPDLVRCGTDILNMSIDTLSSQLHYQLTGCDDLPDILNALEKCCKNRSVCKSQYRSASQSQRTRN